METFEGMELSDHENPQIIITEVRTLLDDNSMYPEGEGDWGQNSSSSINQPLQPSVMAQMELCHKDSRICVLCVDYLDELQNSQFQIVETRSLSDSGSIFPEREEDSLQNISNNEPFGSTNMSMEAQCNYVVEESFECEYELDESDVIQKLCFELFPPPPYSSEYEADCEEMSCTRVQRRKKKLKKIRRNSLKHKNLKMKASTVFKPPRKIKRKTLKKKERRCSEREDSS